MRYLLLIALALLLATAPVQAETYYIGPDGDDANAGTAAEAPWQTFGHAFSRLAPGDTLLLLDGVYRPRTTGRFNADGFAEAQSGTEAQPITVRAQNERRAHIKSDGQDAAILVQNLSWWNLHGLRASNQDDSTATKGGEGIKLINTRHMTLRRMLAHNNNRYRNSQMVMIVLSRDVLVEESEIYNFHRNGFEAYRSEDVTFRRCYANSRGIPEQPGGYGSGNAGGSSTFIGYYARNLVVENCISENRNHGFSGNAGLSTRPYNPDSLAKNAPAELEGYEHFDRLEAEPVRPSGRNLLYVGNVSLRDNRGGNIASRHKEQGGIQDIRNARYKNFLIVDHNRRGYISRAVHDLTMDNVTVLNGDGEDRYSGMTFTVNLDPQRRTPQGYYFWPSCEMIDGCTYRFSNWLVAGNEGPVFDSDLAAYGEEVDFQAAYSNFYNNGGLGLDEEISDGEGRLQRSMQEDPAGIGLGEGACAVYIPEPSNMSGAGKGGADIGANILYRYHNGELTDEPLWDPQTGAFPHGAVIEGMNDVEGESAFDVHKRLNVNTNGCRLPYNETGSGAKAYYIGPDGSDQNSGTSENEPLGTFEEAIGTLQPGDTLVLLDGVYTPETTGRLATDGLEGTADAPIVIRAQNERRAHVKGNGDQPPVDLRNSRHLVIHGVQASSTDNPDGRLGDIVWVDDSEHITLRRLLAHHTNRHDNAAGVNIHESQHALVEESELYYFHRNGFTAFQSEDVTFRRCYANSRAYPPLGSEHDEDAGGDTAFRSYYSNDFLTENSISETRNNGLSAASGRNTVTGDTSGQHIAFLGNISMGDEYSGALGSRDKSDLDDGGLQPMRDLRYENHLAIGFLRIGFVTRAVGDLTMENVTMLNGKAEVFGTNLEPVRNWPSCATIGGCQFRLTNWLVKSNTGPVFEDVPTGDESVSFLATHANFYQSGNIGLSEGISDSAGQIQQSMQEEPTGMGLSEGECAVFIPERSNMSGAGEGGADIGANILYRYEDGELTDEPLWNPQTGAFPHGAVIEGMNDVAGESAFDVHERLNVNTNGCRLPYASAP